MSSSIGGVGAEAAAAAPLLASRRMASLSAAPSSGTGAGSGAGAGAGFVTIVMFAGLR